MLTDGNERFFKNDIDVEFEVDKSDSTYQIISEMQKRLYAISTKHGITLKVKLIPIENLEISIKVKYWSKAKKNEIINHDYLCFLNEFLEETSLLEKDFKNVISLPME